MKRPRMTSTNFELKNTLMSGEDISNVPTHTILDLISVGVQGFHQIFVLINMLVVHISFNKIFIYFKNILCISNILPELEIYLILLFNIEHIMNALDFNLKGFIMACVHVNKKPSCQFKIIIFTFLNQCE